jgi:hypothetical protein
MIQVVHPGTGSWIFTQTGSRIQGSKRHRIPDPDPKHWQEGKINGGKVPYLPILKESRQMLWCLYVKYIPCPGHWCFLSREANRYYTLYDTFIFTDSSIMASGSAYILNIKIPASNNYYWNLRDGEPFLWCFRFLPKITDVELSYVLFTTVLIMLTYCTYVKVAIKFCRCQLK